MAELAETGGGVEELGSRTCAGASGGEDGTLFARRALRGGVAGETGGRTGDASSSGRLDEAWETGTLASREEGVGLRAGQTVIGSRGRAGLARGVAGLALAG